MTDLSTKAKSELMAIIHQNGGNRLLFSVFGSGVSGATQALSLSAVPAGVRAEALWAYREIAIRNIDKEVQRIRLQVVDQLLRMMGEI